MRGSWPVTDDESTSTRAAQLMSAALGRTDGARRATRRSPSRARRERPWTTRADAILSRPAARSRPFWRRWTRAGLFGKDESGAPTARNQVAHEHFCGHSAPIAGSGSGSHPPGWTTGRRSAARTRLRPAPPDVAADAPASTRRVFVDGSASRGEAAEGAEAVTAAVLKPLRRCVRVRGPTDRPSCPRSRRASRAALYPSARARAASFGNGAWSSRAHMGARARWRRRGRWNPPSPTKPSFAQGEPSRGRQGRRAPRA